MRFQLQTVKYYSRCLSLLAWQVLPPLAASPHPSPSPVQHVLPSVFGGISP